MAAYDLVLKGGHVVDPGQSLDAKMDVAFHAGRVAALAKTIAVPAGVEARDVSGLIVTPGLIDMHTHVYWGGTSLGIDAEDFCRKSAVTTAIDTGSAGPGNFAGLPQACDRALSGQDPGLSPYFTRRDFRLFQSHHGGRKRGAAADGSGTAVEVATANRDLIVGIKVRLGRWASGSTAWCPSNMPCRWPKRRACR